METVNVSQTHIDRAQEVIDRQVVEGTKRNYSSILINMANWLHNNYPETVQEVHSNEGAAIEYTIILPISREVVMAYMGAVQRRDEHGNPVEQGGKLMAVSTMNMIGSAINYLYRIHGIQHTMDPRLKAAIKDFMAGHRRMVAIAKGNGELPLFEGKRAISFSGYHKLAKYALEKQTSRLGSFYSHLFIVLSWNLFARSHSIASLMFNHFEWKEDSLLITLPRHKGDQEGIKVYPVHVYANPLSPFICPLLALAIHVFCTQSHTANGQQNWKLFAGGSFVQHKFSNWLQELLQSNVFTDGELGALKTELGTHSFRKGGVTYVLSFPGGPNVVSAYLRARWSLGAVQQRYVFEGEGVDQLCGRTACGLPLSEPDFAILPPHFISNFIISPEQWQELHANYNEYPQAFKQVMPYLLASIIYHRQFLRDTLASNHPLFSTFLWTSRFVDNNADKVILGRKICFSTNMKATGIPQHLSIMHELLKVVDQLSTVNRALEETKKALESKLESLGEVLPERVSSHILSHISINGAVPITFYQVESLVGNLRDQLFAHISEMGNARNTESGNNQQQQNTNQTNANTRFDIFYWKGAYHPVPEDFKFPSIPVKLIWDLWFHGDEMNRIGAYQKIKKGDLQTNAQKVNLVRARKVIKTIFEFADVLGAVPGDVTEENLSNKQRNVSQCIFQAGFQHLKDIFKLNLPASIIGNRRWDELQYSTFYDDINKLQIDKYF